MHRSFAHGVNPPLPYPISTRCPSGYTRRCAEDCLNSDTCRSFATHLEDNGICCLSDYNKDTVKPPATYQAEDGLE